MRLTRIPCFILGAALSCGAADHAAAASLTLGRAPDYDLEIDLSAYTRQPGVFTEGEIVRLTVGFDMTVNPGVIPWGEDWFFAYLYEVYYVEFDHASPNVALESPRLLSNYGSNSRNPIVMTGYFDLDITLTEDACNAWSCGWAAFYWEEYAMTIDVWYGDETYNERFDGGTTRLYFLRAPFVAPTPVPIGPPGVLLATALGALAAMRRRARSA